MSDVSWDDDDFEPAKAAPVLPSDKWDGEDEEDVKDNWDDEDEEKPAATATTASSTDATAAAATAAQAKKKKKKIGDIIAEKEAKQQEEAERRRRDVEERAEGQTAAGRLAEKLRLQKVQEDADLQLATELVGTAGADDDSRLLEGVDLNTTEGLSSLRHAVVAKVRATDRLEKRPHFITFVEDLARDLCQNLEMDEVKRVTAVLNTLYNEKMRASKPKSRKKQTGKAKLNVGSGAIADDYTNDFGAEYEDFI